MGLEWLLNEEKMGISKKMLIFFEIFFDMQNGCTGSV